MSEEKRALAIKFGGRAFLEAVGIYGATAVCQFLLRITQYCPENFGKSTKRDDWLINEFLVISVTTIVVSNFLKKAISFEVTEEEWNYWNEKGRKIGLL